MKSINIVECKNEKDLKEVSILAEKIWHEFFPGIISEAQIDYSIFLCIILKLFTCIK